MIKLFSRYLSIGIVNTLIHWTIFALIFYMVYPSQAISNFIGFIVAVTFSFFANSKFTFKKKATGVRYTLFVAFMGFISLISGMTADYISLQPFITMVIFSGMSLFVGFLYSNFFVFKDSNEK
ncbi:MULTISPECIES: GtrA family protein [Rahnella]|uniref:Bactoprenol-linked glucose translocase n=1 Tax=Rahnella laticis TaxID=2787622 RepID=A0ABS0E0P8_9GAMM|nr:MULTISPECIES: GtrA family protein [Rahnella]MBF7978656.1 GtrA family protein [Rahnella laticis]MBF7998746.1 GtrA family protein [Rahnella sp. LAC-M12]